MAKRKLSKKTTTKRNKEQLEHALPQNIVLFGERVEEDKNIYISQKVYKEIHRFTRDKTTNESGGMLIGTIIEEFGKTNIVINGFIEAKHSEGTPTTLKFTHETWEYVHKESAKKFPEQKIVGWIHTHPDFGIFLSEYDKFIHENFFQEDYQIAYVVDPIQHIEGFYFWINGKIERCKGFYVFDKTGAKITVNDEEKDNESGSRSPEPPFSLRNVLLGVLTAAVVVLIFMNMSLSNRITKLEQQQSATTETVNYMAQLWQQVMFSSSQPASPAVETPAPSQEPPADTGSGDVFVGDEAAPDGGGSVPDDSGSAPDDSGTSPTPGE